MDVPNGGGVYPTLCMVVHSGLSTFMEKAGMQGVEQVAFRTNIDRRIGGSVKRERAYPKWPVSDTLSQQRSV